MPTDKATKKTNVVVVDNDEDVCLYLNDILEMEGNFNCMRCFSSGDEAVKETPALRPDLVMMDINMPGLDGIECTRRLKQLMPSLEIVMVTGLFHENFIKSSLNAGAGAYLLKPFTVEQCLATLKWIIESHPAEKSNTVELALAMQFNNSSLLTQRENEVMRHLAAGLLYKEIAAKMGVSFLTIHKHQHKIFQKLQVMNRTEAILKWRGKK